MLKELYNAGLVKIAVAVAILACPAPVVAVGNVTVKDTFDRTINARGISLVDWEGYLANPAIKLTVTVPANAVLPASAVLTANHQRLYFNSPCSVGANGPSKTISFSSTTKTVTVYMSIFPDRDGLEENYTLNIALTDKAGAKSTTQVPVRVIDQDGASVPNFSIITDYSTDQTGFFSDPLKRTVIEQAAGDWAYFIDGTGLNQVAARAESTWIWGQYGWGPGSAGFTVTNSYAYTGFLLYAYGIHTPELRSGGEGSYGGGYQRIGTTQLPLRRSGGLEIETQGNYNTLGWFVTTSDDDWWATWSGNPPNDLYSIAHHEIGHSIAWCDAYPRALDARNKGYYDDPAIVGYLGRTLPVDSVHHFAGIVDPASKRGVFGSEYNGSVPGHRWLITKLDLLVLQACGYTLRNTSAFAPLAVAPGPLAPATMGKPYSGQITVSGGIPSYACEVTGGTLPAGLSLDSFTGAISGTPTGVGSGAFTVRVRDNSPAGAAVTADLSIIVLPATSRAVGLSNVSARQALATRANEQMLFVVWGKVKSSDANGLVLDDGSGCPITVKAPGHTVKTNDWARACGVLSDNSGQITLTTTADQITPIN